jgi:hypothetical protein
MPFNGFNTDVGWRALIGRFLLGGAESPKGGLFVGVVADARGWVVFFGSFIGLLALTP